MCGRFVSASSASDLAAYFSATPTESVLAPSYNVAPTNDVYVVFTDGEATHLSAFHWGLVPSWAKDPSIGNRMINARAESITEKAVFRNALRKRRCLIPADGFYEWAKRPGQKKKQPYYLSRADHEPLAFAGLWEEWRRDDEAPLRSCTIITCAPNETMAPIHDRMPVILPPTAWDRWLGRVDEAGGLPDATELTGLLVPAPPSLLVVTPVSTEVNNVRNAGPQLIEPAAELPLEDEDPQASASE